MPVWVMHKTAVQNRVVNALLQGELMQFLDNRYNVVPSWQQTMETTMEVRAK